MKVVAIAAGAAFGWLAAAGPYATHTGSFTHRLDQYAARGNASGAPPDSQSAASRDEARGNASSPEFARRGNAIDASSSTRLSARGNDSGKARPA